MGRKREAGVGWGMVGGSSEETHGSIFSVRCWDTYFEHLAPYPKNKKRIFFFSKSKIKNCQVKTYFEPKVHE